MYPDRSPTHKHTDTRGHSLAHIHTDTRGRSLAQKHTGKHKPGYTNTWRERTGGWKSLVLGFVRGRRIHSASKFSATDAAVSPAVLNPTTHMQAHTAYEHK